MEPVVPNEEHVKTGKGILDRLESFSSRELRTTYRHYRAVRRKAVEAGAQDVVEEVDFYIKSVKAVADRHKVRV